MSEKRWYIVQTYSGHEYSVKTELEARIKTLGQQDTIFNVVIPEEDVIVTKKDGTQVTKKTQLFSGYVFVEMIITEKSWFIVRNTPRVTGFLGSSGNGAKPIPLPPDEINPILRQINFISQDTEEQEHVDFEVGETIEITNGALVGKTFEISSINLEKKTVTIMFEVFGRITPTEVEFSDIKKAE